MAHKKTIKAAIRLFGAMLYVKATYHLIFSNYEYFSCSLKLSNRNTSYLLSFENRSTKIDAIIVTASQAYNIHRFLISPQFYELIKSRLVCFEQNPLTAFFEYENSLINFTNMAPCSDGFFIVSRNVNK